MLMLTLCEAIFTIGRHVDSVDEIAGFPDPKMSEGVSAYKLDGAVPLQEWQQMDSLVALMTDCGRRD